MTFRLDQTLPRPCLHVSRHPVHGMWTCMDRERECKTPGAPQDGKVNSQNATTPKPKVSSLDTSYLWDTQCIILPPCNVLHYHLAMYYTTTLQCIVVQRVIVEQAHPIRQVHYKAKLWPLQSYSLTTHSTHPTRESQDPLTTHSGC